MFVRAKPLAFPALHLSAREGCPGHCGTLTPIAVLVENALVLLTWFFCAVAPSLGSVWHIGVARSSPDMSGDLSMQVKLTVNNFWRPLRMVSAAKSMVALLCRIPLPQRRMSLGAANRHANIWGGYDRHPSSLAQCIANIPFFLFSRVCSSCASTAMLLASCRS